jgi:hypothetical protein
MNFADNIVFDLGDEESVDIIFDESWEEHAKKTKLPIGRAISMQHDIARAISTE